MTDTIAGFIPKSKYALIAYALVLIAAAGGLITTLLAMAGIYLPLGRILSICGIVGLIMALLGAFLFNKDLPELDRSHMLYISIVFAALYIIGMVLGNMLSGSIMLALLIALFIAGAEFVLLFTGFNSWKHGRAMTKDNIGSEAKLAIKRA
jgi:hypothetical protein